MDIETIMKLYDTNGSAINYIKIGRNNGLEGCIAYLISVTGCTREDAIAVMEKYEFMKPQPISPEEAAYNNMVAREWLNVPQCPTCSSQNLRKISTTAKVVNTAAFGVFGTKRHKTFHCNNCGYEW